MRLTTTDDQKMTTIKALVYGDSGIGKTTSLTKLPIDKTLIVNSERGTVALRHHKFKLVNLESWSDLREVYLAFAMPESCKNKELVSLAENTKILALDSISGISEMCMAQILNVERRELIDMRTRGKTDVPENVYPEQMTMEDYGLYRTRMINLISSMCKLPKQVIMTCGAEWYRDKQGGETTRAPALSGKAARQCCAYFDLVLYMDAKEPQADGNGSTRVWQTFKDRDVLAKDASGVLSPYEEPDWIKVMGKILGHKLKRKMPNDHVG